MLSTDQLLTLADIVERLVRLRNGLTNSDQIALCDSVLNRLRQLVG